MSKATPVVIALGSNVGDSLAYLQRAVALLRGRISVEVVSSAYRTAPMYVENQPPFVNAALLGQTDLGPRALLRELKAIEAEIGREARERYGPREIDLDLIAYGNLAYAFEDKGRVLELPHSKVPERRFVLAPLAEIAPGFKVVGQGTASELLERTNSDADAVERITDAKL